MDNECNQKSQASPFAGADCGRESAESVLKQTSETLRRQALFLIQEADGIEQAARYCAGMQGPIEATMYSLAIAYRIRLGEIQAMNRSF